MDRFMPMKTKKVTYSIPTIRKMLGLGKTESYWLIEHRKFETVVLHGHVRVTKASFEEWYENQIKYKKVDGTPPGRMLREKSYSIDELAEELAVSTSTIYELIKRKCFDTVLVDSWMRIPKDSFQKWYCTQEVYRTAEDRKKDEKLRATSYSMPDIRKMLGVHRNTVYSILDHPNYREQFEFLFVAGQKRITKESFEKWYLSQSRYVKVIEKAEIAPPAPEVLTDTEPEKPEFSEKAFYKIEEVQSILNISKKAMYKLIQDGNIFAVRVGKNYVIPNGEVKRITGGR